jgi:pyrimidine-nucleoside phosphorylase
MLMAEIIEKKKCIGELSEKEIAFFVRGYTEGTIPDYQASALLMAIYFNGLSSREVLCLTKEMAASGGKIDLSDIPGVKADKHSSGGVGDKTTLVVLPIVASCGVKMAKMSGRGLGFTGGTIDKLCAIPGMRMDLSLAEIKEQVQEIGLCIAGQSRDLAPADKKLYALRDVTATVDSPPLIASSIMSKKIVCGADSLLLDVKVGSGALMKDLEDAKDLAELMVEIGEEAGIRTAALLTDMSQPLGYAVGNAIEVIEAVEVLKNHETAKDFRKLCVQIAAWILVLCDVVKTKKEGERLAEEKIVSGEAFEKLRACVRAQGAMELALDNYSLMPQAKNKIIIEAETHGYVSQIKCDEIGRVSVLCGAGRAKKEDSVDYGAGILIRKKRGDYVREGDILAEVYTERMDDIQEIKKRIVAAYQVSKERLEEIPLVYDCILKK